MHTRLPFVLWLLSINAQAQFALEHAYPNAGTPTSNNQFYLVELEDFGHRYVWFDRANLTLTFYDLSHVQVQVIDLSAAPDPAPGVAGGKQLLYISQYLFDLDPGVEVMYFAGGGLTPPMLVTSIVDESGAVIQSFPDEAAYVLINAPQTQLPIYNTPAGTKMILSHQVTNEAKVYSLPGELTTGMVIASENMAMAGQVRVFPNPANGEVTVAIEPTSSFGELIFRFFAEDGRLQLERGITGTETIIDSGSWSAGAYTYVVSRDGVPWCSGSVIKQ